MPCPTDTVDLTIQEMEGEMEKQKELEKEKESDAVDVFGGQPAETAASHRRAAEKQRYNTLGYQKKKKPPVDFSTVSKGTSGNTKSRGALKQVLFNQSPSEKTSTSEDRGVSGTVDQMEILKQTLESFPVPAELSWKWGEEDKTTILEKSWTDIVDSHEFMSKIQRHQQEALWELIYTEFIYINKLTIITDIVLAALEYVHQRGFLLEVTSAQLFSNLPSILDAHKSFWQEVMYPMLKNVRVTGQPFDPLKLEPGCLQFAERFSAYLDYCWEEEKNVEFTRRQQETNTHFQTYLMWVETHPQCARMRLGDMQAKPHQRITKYHLLLKAILRTTEDPHTQYALHCMLTSVSQFLDSINDYLQFKDDELALSVLSQRIEGYEMHGMNEEIDKYMQEFCRFDLTSPIQGIRHKAIRKLLQEETLKVRGRKDSKLEVVVLLFTDVLLLTKSQKKSEKLKVVHPPLSLERIHCAELKDGYSFVLVEMSDLGCAVSVYSVSAPSPDSCTAWVSAIHQAQEALENLRKGQNHNKPKKPQNQTGIEELEIFAPLSKQVTENKEELQEKQTEFTNTFSPVTSGLKFRGNLSESEEYLQIESQPVDGEFTGKQMQNGGKLFTDESERTKGSVNGHEEESDILFGVNNERRVTWNHKIEDTNVLLQRDLEASQVNGPHPLLVGGLMENAAPSESLSGHLEPAVSKAQHTGFTSIERAIQQDSNTQESDSWQSGEEDEGLSESARFSRKLKSPRLRKKRLMTSQSSAPAEGSRGDKTEPSRSLTHINSSSNSDSDGNNSIHRSSNSSSKPQDSHLVLNLGSLKRNRGVFWNNPTERLSPDLQTLSEPELVKETPEHQKHSLKIPKMTSQRRSSTPEVHYSEAKSLPVKVLTQRSDPQLHPSPLQGLLNRAKERERERGIAKRDGKPIEKSVNCLQNPISVPNSPSPSPSPSEGERETEREEHNRPRGKCYTDRLRESNVDGNSPGTPLGASVDWSGWCFDDKEVLEFLRPSDRTVDWLEQTLTTREMSQTPRQEDGEYSEV